MAQFNVKEWQEREAALDAAVPSNDKGLGDYLDQHVAKVEAATQDIPVSALMTALSYVLIRRCGLMDVVDTPLGPLLLLDRYRDTLEQVIKSVRSMAEGPVMALFAEEYGFSVGIEIAKGEKAGQEAKSPDTKPN